MSLSKTIGNNLIHLRIKNNYSIENLCKELNYSICVYSQYESGKVEAPSNFLVHVSKFYDVDLDSLLEDNVE